jgi:5-methylthioribose kinase
MFELSAENAAAALRELGLAPCDRGILVEPLSGGVSNLVLKQSREKLRTKAEWLSRVDRIWIERDALILLGEVLPETTVPKVLFYDESNYLLAISHAPAGSRVWKEQLLEGDLELERGRQAGETLALMHAALVEHSGLSGRLSDSEVFDQLRIDPYYRRIAQVHPTVRPAMDRIVNQLTTTRPRTFVHADFSPKNILVYDRGIFVVDFETAHRGDPAFDLGFFLSHLILKAMRAQSRKADFLQLATTFWKTYLGRIAGTTLAEGLEPRSLANCFACLLARIDGKSPVDYLDESARGQVRARAVDGLLRPADDWQGFLGRFE